MKLHDEIKKKYEQGDYDPPIKGTSYYSNPDKLGWYYQVRKRIFILWIILFIITFVPVGHLIANDIAWLYNIFVILFVLNTLGLIYSHLRILRLKKDTHLK